MNFGRIALLPMILTQGLWVASRAVQMPAPEGPRSGVAGRGPRLRLLIVGDSSAEGVGVAHQDAALSGQTVARLATEYTVQWRVIAASGATALETVKRLQKAEAEEFDVAITALGVNDSKNGVSAAAWQANYLEIFDVLKSKFCVRNIITCGLPPIDDFPLLPNPLRTALACRARYFEALLHKLADKDDAVTLLSMPGSLDPEKMAADGFHPGPEIYDDWAELAAPMVAKVWGATVGLQQDRQKSEA